MPLMTRSQKVELENLIDKYTLTQVIEALSEICGEKAEHVETTWQDKELAKAWSRAEGQLGVLSTEIEEGI